MRKNTATTCYGIYCSVALARVPALRKHLHRASHLKARNPLECTSRKPFSRMSKFEGVEWHGWHRRRVKIKLGEKKKDRKERAGQKLRTECMRERLEVADRERGQREDAEAIRAKDAKVIEDLPIKEEQEAANATERQRNAQAERERKRKEEIEEFLLRAASYEHYGPLSVSELHAYAASGRDPRKADAFQWHMEHVRLQSVAIYEDVLKRREYEFVERQKQIAQLGMESHRKEAMIRVQQMAPAAQEAFELLNQAKEKLSFISIAHQICRKILLPACQEFEMTQAVVSFDILELHWPLDAINNVYEKLLGNKQISPGWGPQSPKVYLSGCHALEHGLSDLKDGIEKFSRLITNSQPQSFPQSHLHAWNVGNHNSYDVRLDWTNEVQHTRHYNFVDQCDTSCAVPTGGITTAQNDAIDAHSLSRNTYTIMAPASIEALDDDSAPQSQHQSSSHAINPLSSTPPEVANVEQISRDTMEESALDMATLVTSTRDIHTCSEETSNVPSILHENSEQYQPIPTVSSPHPAATDEPQTYSRPTTPVIPMKDSLANSSANLASFQELSIGSNTSSVSTSSPQKSNNELGSPATDVLGLSPDRITTNLATNHSKALESKHPFKRFEESSISSPGDRVPAFQALTASSKTAFLTRLRSSVSTLNTHVTACEKEICTNHTFPRSAAMALNSHFDYILEQAKSLNCKIDPEETKAFGDRVQDLSKAYARLNGAQRVWPWIVKLIDRIRKIRELLGIPFVRH